MSKKSQLPEVRFAVIVGKGRDKVRHKHTVLEFAEDGWPKLLRLIRGDEVIDLEARTKSPSFLTAYCQQRSLGPWESVP
jgi:hypothetical protein